MEVITDPKPKSKAQKLYEILNADDTYKGTLPDIASFEKRLQEPGFASNFYDVLKDDPTYKGTLPEKDQFINEIYNPSLKKKHSSQDFQEPSQEYGDGQTPPQQLEERLDEGFFGPLSQKSKDEVLQSQKIFNPTGQEEVYDEEEAKRLALGGLNKERNPVVSFGKKAWESLAYQLPSSAAATGALLLGSSKDLVRIAEGGSKGIYDILNRDEIYSKKAKKEIENILKTNDRLYNGVKERKIQYKEYKKFLDDADERIKFLNQEGFVDGVKDDKIESAQKSLITLANEHQEKGTNLSRNITDRLEEVNDVIGALNWVSSVLGQGAAQIFPTILSGGASSLAQEIGGIYLDQIKKTADEKNITVSEVIDRNMDDRANSMAYGIAAGLLDRVSAGSVITAMGKDKFKKSMRNMAIQYLSKATAPEALTEGTQTILEQVGAGRNIDWEEVREAVAQGAVAGTGLSIAGGEVNRIGSSIKSKNKKTDNQVTNTDANQPDIAGETIQKDNPIDDSQETKTHIEKTVDVDEEAVNNQGEEQLVIEDEQKKQKSEPVGKETDSPPQVDPDDAQPPKPVPENKDRFYRNDGKVFIEVESAKPVDSSEDLFSYKNNQGDYEIVEGRSGAVIAKDKSRGKAVGAAINKITSRPEKFNQAVQKSIDDKGLSPRYENISPVGKETENIEKIDQDIDEILGKEKKPKPQNVAKSILNPLQPVFQVLDKSQKAIFSKPMNRLENHLAKKTNEGLRKQKYFARNAVGTLKNIVGGLTYTDKTLKNKREYQGNKNYAYIRAKSFMDDTYGILGGDAKSLPKIHAALDPDFYKNSDYEGITYEDLDQKEKAVFDVLRRTNDYIHDFHFSKNLINKETYKKHKGKYIARLYEETEMDIMPDDLKPVYNQNKADLGMFQQRKDGVSLTSLKDPVYATAKRIAQMIQNQAIFDYTDQIIKSKDIKTSDAPFEGATQLSADKPVYGKLTNKYVPNYIAEDFKGFFFENRILNDLYGAFRGYDRLNVRQIMKKSHTVYSPLTRMGNIVSNFSFSFWSNVDPITFLKNRAAAKKQIKERGDHYIKLVKAGILGTDVVSGDLKPLASRTESKTLVGEIDNKISDILNRNNRISKGLKNLDNWFSSTYAKADDVAKLSAYISKVEDYKMDESEAIQDVYDGFQNYSAVGKLYDFAAKTPIVGNQYIKFKADLARIMKNLITKRPLTGMAYLGLLSWIKDMFSDASGEDDIVQEARERRPFTPKIKTPLGDISLLWNVPGVGEVNFARYITPYYMYDKGSQQDVVNSVSEWLPYQVEMSGTVTKNINIPTPELPDVFLGVYAQVIFDKDFRGKSIRDPEGNKFKGNATTDEQIFNSLNYIARSQIPFVTSSQNIIDAYNGDVDYYGRERTISQAILNNIIKVQNFGKAKVRKQLTSEVQYKVKQFESYSRDISSIKNDTKENINEISQRKINTQKKEELIKKQVEKMKKRIAGKLKKQQKIVEELEKPQEIIKKIDSL